MIERSNIILKCNVYWPMLEYELTNPLDNQRLYETIKGIRLRLKASIS